MRERRKEIRENRSNENIRRSGGKFLAYLSESQNITLGCMSLFVRCSPRYLVFLSFSLSFSAPAEYSGRNSAKSIQAKRTREKLWTASSLILEHTSAGQQRYPVRYLHVYLFPYAYIYAHSIFIIPAALVSPASHSSRLLSSLPFFFSSPNVFKLPTANTPRYVRIQRNHIKNYGCCLIMYRRLRFPRQ